MLVTDNTPTDEDLFNRYKKGEQSAFETLYQRWRKPLYAYLHSAVPSGIDIDDLYQELWLRIIKAADKFTGDGFRYWVFRIARNLCIDRGRRAHLKAVDDREELPETPDPKPSLAQQADADDCAKRFRLELAALPNDQREALVLKEETGLSLAAIAELVDTGKETIKSRLRYAMKRLREKLEDCL